MRLKGITDDHLAQWGFDLNELYRIPFTTEEHLPEAVDLLWKVSACIGLDMAYVQTGSVPKNLKANEMRRLELYELLEAFCTRMELAMEMANKFITSTMRRYEQHLAHPVFAVHNDGVPSSYEDVLWIFVEWKKQRRGLEQ
jgi:hypothetical protein